MIVNSLKQCSSHNCCSLRKNVFGGGFNSMGFSPSSEASQAFVSSTFQSLIFLHSKGPYNNMRDKSIVHYTGGPLFCFSQALCTEQNVTYHNDVNLLHHSETLNKHSVSQTICAEERVCGQNGVTFLSQSETLKKTRVFDSNIVFVSQPSMPLGGKETEPLDMNNSEAYLAAVSDILSSGLPNYCGRRLPFPSVFNWKYIEKDIG